jgi:glycosyltransferase involved in cell wall biosynthesis
MPKVSLIMTVYDRDRYLRLALESVLSQTFQDWELILWMDGSGPECLAIAQEFAGRDRRIWLAVASHQGRSIALSAAHALAQGDYVGWIDSDDVLGMMALERTVAVLNENSTVGMVYTDHQLMDENGLFGQIGWRCQIPYDPERLLTQFMTFHFRLIRRSIFELAGGIDESFACAIDHDLCLRISEVTEVEHLPEVLYYYRNHRNSMFHQNSLEQIYCSQRAAENAMVRRGMGDRFELELEILGRLHLRSKPKGIAP